MIQRDNIFEDRRLADQEREQDYEFASKTNQLSILKRQHKIVSVVQRYRDAILVSYMNKISIVLRKYSGSCTRDPLRATLVRLKTLTIIQ